MQVFSHINFKFESVGISNAFKTGIMWKPGSQSISSSPAEFDFWNLCNQNVHTIKNFANDGNLLNQRQCLDLSSKLLKITRNICELVFHCGASVRPALEHLYRSLEKARVLVHDCGAGDWCTAAVFQSQNENAFQEILLEVGLCYNVIYELAERSNKDSNGLPEDLRRSLIFRPATASDVLQDQLDLLKRLESLAGGHSSVSLVNCFRPRNVSLKRRLASYMLQKLSYTTEQSQTITIDSLSAILWKEAKLSFGETWGNKYFLGTGSGASGRVYSTTWLGIPCVKKEFHEESEMLFLKEVTVLYTLNHPNIVKFLCCGNGQERGDRFIAMELMQKSLANLIEEHKDASFPPFVDVDLVIQIARGMCYLHDRGVAHRDLKPQNVIVNKVNSVHTRSVFLAKLADFGTSRSTNIPLRNIKDKSIAYMAPEVLRLNDKGKATWFKADIYSFGIMAAHILSRKTPFEEIQDLSELSEKIVLGRRPEIPEKYPGDLVMLVKSCWHCDPLSRPSFVEIYSSLEKIRHRILVLSDHGFKENMDLRRGFEYIEQTMVQSDSSIRRLFVDITDEEAKVYRGDGMSASVSEHMPYTAVGSTSSPYWPDGSLEYGNLASRSPLWQAEFGHPSRVNDYHGYQYQQQPKVQSYDMQLTSSAYPFARSSGAPKCESFTMFPPNMTIDVSQFVTDDVSSTEVQNRPNSMQPQQLLQKEVSQILVNTIMASLGIGEIQVQRRLGDFFQGFQSHADVIAGRFDTKLMQIQILFPSLETMVGITGVGLKLNPNDFVLVILSPHDSSKVIMTAIEKNECERLGSSGGTFYFLHFGAAFLQNQDHTDTSIHGEVLSTSSEFDSASDVDMEQHESFETKEEDSSSYAAYRVHSVAKLLLLLRCRETGDLSFWSKVKDFLLVWDWEDIKIAIIDDEEKRESIYNASGGEVNKRGGNGDGNGTSSFSRLVPNLSSSSRKDKAKCNHEDALDGGGDMGDDGKDDGGYNHEEVKLHSSANAPDKNYSIEVHPGYSCYREVYNERTWPYKGIHVYATPVITISFRNCCNHGKREVHTKLEVNFDLANGSGPEPLDLENKQFAWYHDSFEFSIQCIDDRAAQLKAGSGNVLNLEVVKSLMTNTTTKDSNSAVNTFSTELKTTALLPVQNTTKVSTTRGGRTLSLAAGETREGLNRETAKGFLAREKFEGGPKPRIGCAFKYAKSKEIESSIHEADGRFPDMESYRFEHICSSQYEVIEGAFQPIQEEKKYYEYVFDCQRNITGLFWVGRTDEKGSCWSKLKEKVSCTSEGKGIKNYKYWEKVTCEQRFDVPLYINHAMKHIHRLAKKHPDGIPPLRGCGGYKKVLVAIPLEEKHSVTKIDL